MPECYEILGVKICFPSVDDLVQYVTTPITNLINSVTSDFWADMINRFTSVSRNFDTVIGKIRGLQDTTLYHLLTSRDTLINLINNRTMNIINDLSSLGTGIMNSFANSANLIASSINLIPPGFLAGANNIVAALQNLSEQLVKMLESKTPHDKLQEYQDKIQKLIDMLVEFMQKFLMPTEPRSPEKAVEDAWDYVKWGNAIFGAITLLSIAIETISLGQIDFTLTQIYNIPAITAYLNTVRYITARALEYSLELPLRYGILAKTTPFIPSPSDLVRFVVRECFPLEELPRAPDEFTKYMRYQGYSELWSRAYWEAHWELPAPEKLYDAFHRGIISEEELRKYIVWHDYKPEPRPGISKSDVDIMLELTYDLPNKIETRHMMQLVLLTDDDIDYLVKAAGIHPRFRDKYKVYVRKYAYRSDIRNYEREARYLYAQGKIDINQYRKYLRKANIPPELHDMFVELAELYKLRRQKESEQTEKQVTYYQYAQAYRRGIISEAEFRDRLKGLGYPEDVVDLLVAVETDRKYESLEKSLIDAIEDLFEYEIIDENTLRSMLQSLELDEREIELRVQIRKLRQARKKKYLTATQVLRAYKAGIIDQNTAAWYLKYKLHYDDFEVAVLMQLYAPRVIEE